MISLSLNDKEFLHGDTCADAEGGEKLLAKYWWSKKESGISIIIIIIIIAITGFIFCRKFSLQVPKYFLFLPP